MPAGAAFGILRRMQNPSGGRTLPLVVVSFGLLTALASGCRFVSTPLGRLARDPMRFQGQEVTVSGRVLRTTRLPEIGVHAFTLSDGRDSILVLTEGAPPPLGSSARVQGGFRRAFPVGDRTRPVLIARANRTRADNGSQDAR